MQFLSKYKQGGERSDKTGSLGGYVYFSKQDEQDVVLRLEKAFVKVSENPKNIGAEKGIFVFSVVSIETSQDGLDVGDEVSMMVNLSPKNDLAIEPALKEFVSILSACTGTSEKDYFKSLNSVKQGEVSLVESHLEDDAIAFQGNLIHVTTPNKPNKAGWYDLHMESVKPAAKAKKAS